MHCWRSLEGFNGIVIYLCDPDLLSSCKTLQPTVGERERGGGGGEREKKQKQQQLYFTRMREGERTRKKHFILQGL